MRKIIMVIWQIDCDERGKSKMVQASSNENMVNILISKGFRRILNDDVPYQNEPLVFTKKSTGEVYDAMPVSIDHASLLPDFRTI
jgi:hypothetical protein